MSSAALDNLGGTHSLKKKKMEEAWEEALDLDNSDFQSILRPCNRPVSIPTDHTLSQLHSTTSLQTLNNNFTRHQQNPQTLVASQPSQSQTSFKRPRVQTQLSVSQPDSFLNAGNVEAIAASQRSTVVDVPPRSIPGPAGAVLAALRRRRVEIRETESEEEMTVLSTQEYLKKAVDGNGANSEFDDDFKKPTWVAALEFSERDNELASFTAVPLGAIKNYRHSKLPKVIAMIKSLTPNGFGDFMVTLKDPSGTMSASIHRSVVTEGNYGCYLSVGAVLVLQKVSVFSPRAECYLNIVHNNVVKIFPKDFESASNAVSGLPAVANSRGELSATQQTNRGTGNEVGGTVGNFGRQSVGEPLQGNNSNKEAACKSVRCIEKQNECKGDPTVLSSSKDINNTAQAAFVDGSYSSVLHHEQREKADKMIHNPSATAAESNGAIRQMPLSTSLSTLPQWTDEQLEELLLED